MEMRDGERWPSPRAIYTRLKALEPSAPVLVFDTWLYRFFWPIVLRLRTTTRFKLVSFAQLCYWETFRSLPHRASPPGAHPGRPGSGPPPRGREPHPARRGPGLVPPPVPLHGHPSGFGLCESSAPGRRPEPRARGDPLGGQLRRPPRATTCWWRPWPGSSKISRIVSPACGSACSATACTTRRTWSGWNGGWPRPGSSRRSCSRTGRAGPRVSRLFTRAQLFAFASSAEGFGMVVLEAMLPRPARAAGGLWRGPGAARSLDRSRLDRARKPTRRIRRAHCTLCGVSGPHVFWPGGPDARPGAGVRLGRGGRPFRPGSGASCPEDRSVG